MQQCLAKTRNMMPCTYMPLGAVALAVFRRREPLQNACKKFRDLPCGQLFIKVRSPVVQEVRSRFQNDTSRYRLRNPYQLRPAFVPILLREQKQADCEQGTPARVERANSVSLN